MTAFTQDEQWYSDLDWYAVDKQGNIAQFLTGGHRLLPPSFSLDRELSEKLTDYFDNLPFTEGDFVFCPNLERNMRDFEANRMNKNFMHFSKKMAAKGLFSFDSDSDANKDRPYFRVTLPKQALKLTDLPQDIKAILNNLKFIEISFIEDSIIPEEITNKL